MSKKDQLGTFEMYKLGKEAGYWICLQELLQEIKKIKVTGGGNGRRLKAQILELINSKRI